MLSLIPGITKDEANENAILEAAGIEPTQQQQEDWADRGIKICPYTFFPCDCFMLEADQQCYVA